MCKNPRSEPHKSVPCVIAATAKTRISLKPSFQLTKTQPKPEEENYFLEKF